MKKIIILLIYFCFSLAYAQNDMSEREPLTIKMAIDGNESFEQFFEASPYFVEDNILQLYISEKVYVEAETEGNNIISLKTVKENINPEKTIQITFEQTVEDDKHQRVTLTVKNPFNKKLKYNALINILDYEGWHETSIIPIMPNIIGIEMWPDLIGSIVLKDWELLN